MGVVVASSSLFLIRCCSYFNVTVYHTVMFEIVVSVYVVCIVLYLILFLSLSSCELTFLIFCERHEIVFILSWLFVMFYSCFIGLCNFYHESPAYYAFVFNNW